MGDYFNPKFKASKPNEVLPKDIDILDWLRQNPPEGSTPIKADYTAVVDSRFAALDKDRKLDDQYLLIRQKGHAKDRTGAEIIKTFAVVIHRNKGKVTPHIAGLIEGLNYFFEIEQFDGDNIPDFVVRSALHENEPARFIPIKPSKLK